MKKFLLGLILLACPVFGEDAGLWEFPVLLDYDLDASSNTYCVYQTESAVTAGRGTTAFGPGDQVTQLVTTSGASTTVSAVSTSTTDPFATVAVGDMIQFIGADVPGVTNPRFSEVTARASADSITVDTAVTLPAAGVNFRYWARACGTAATDGWFPIGQNVVSTIGVQVTQMNVTAGGITYQVECRQNETFAVGGIIDTGNITVASTVANNPHFTHIEAKFSSCRVGLLLGTDDGGDTGANAERVYIFLSGLR